jgi:hypothetical protein
MAQARAHLAEVTRAADASSSARRAAAVQRAGQDRLDRLEQALALLPEVTAIKKLSGAKDKTPRVSTTDPDARVMKMPDGGFRPAFNVQVATTTDAARVIVGVSVTNRGSDQGQTSPMLAQIEARTGTRPTEYLVDGGYPQHDAIDEAKAIYKQRAATAETVNADGKAHRGLSATALRGLDKVTGGACLFALTYHVLRLITLAA